jgi:Ca-activated chloride channel family protein
MSSSTLHRLSLWGSAFLAVSFLPSCLSKAPSAEVAARSESVSTTAQRSAPVEAKPEMEAPADEGAVAGGVLGGVVAPEPPAPAPAKAFKPAPMDLPAQPMPVMATPPPSEPMLREQMATGRAKAKPATKNYEFNKEQSQGPLVVDRRGDDAEASSAVERGNTFEAHAPNAFTDASADAFSTFAVDVDTASYSLARRYLNQGNLPPAGAVRVEEFVNYFKYRYAPPQKGAFTVHLEGAPSPFAQGRHFLRVGVQGKVISRSQRKPAHLVFLVDTSGSMRPQDRLPLAKEAMKLAVKNLNENDTVAIVTYAGGSRDVLEPTPASDQERIHAAIESLQSGGGTAMGSGMDMAYRHAVKKAAGNVVSRVIVLTDGDTNIGPNLTAESMLESIGKYVAEGVTMTTVGFGMGNYRDDLMEKLADKGNGNCFYVDGWSEAKKVFETQLTGTLEVIAKDVKIQVEFNPEAVRRYRLVGYENRDVADRDFRNDKVDAGEIGAGHNVTALYEVELTGAQASLGTVRIRAKAPNGTEAAEQSFPFERSLLRSSLEAASNDFRFALAVGAAADILRQSPAAEGWSLVTARKLAEGATEGQADRNEFVKLVTQAQALMGASAARGGQ